MCLLNLYKSWNSVSKLNFVSLNHWNVTLSAGSPVSYRAHCQSSFVPSPFWGEVVVGTTRVSCDSLFLGGVLSTFSVTHWIFLFDARQPAQDRVKYAFQRATLAASFCVLDRRETIVDNNISVDSRTTSSEKSFQRRVASDKKVQVGAGELTLMCEFQGHNAPFCGCSFTRIREKWDDLAFCRAVIWTLQTMSTWYVDFKKVCILQYLAEWQTYDKWVDIDMLFSV